MGQMKRKQRFGVIYNVNVYCRLWHYFFGDLSGSYRQYFLFLLYWTLLDSTKFGGR